MINMTSTASSIELIFCVLYDNLISIKCASKVEEKIYKAKKRIDHVRSVTGMQMLCKMPAREVRHNRKTPFTKASFPTTLTNQPLRLQAVGTRKHRGGLW
jgi:hypothetical protein